MREIVLNSPTVKVLLSTLLELDMNKKIVICDADTGNIGNIIHIEEYDGNIELSIKYGEMK